MHVILATPTAGGTMMAAYAQTLISATHAITEAGGTYRLLTVDGADVVISRNLLAHSFLADESATHILFLDNDMAVDAAVFRHFIAQDPPIVGAAYTERRMNLADFHAAMKEEENLPRARALASNYTVRLTPGEKKIRSGMVEATAFGFGCVLIKREVFAALIERKIVAPFVSSKLRESGVEGEIWDFFDEIRLENGDWLSEDYAFCKRVRALGDVPLMAYVGPGVGHVGHFTYGGPYVERLKSGKL
ncbi:MAG: hypothetical protein AAFN79_07530 [Pseudomonadota bacterium]